MSDIDAQSLPPPFVTERDLEKVYAGNFTPVIWTKKPSEMQYSDAVQLVALYFREHTDYIAMAVHVLQSPIAWPGKDCHFHAINF